MNATGKVMHRPTWVVMACGKSTSEHCCRRTTCLGPPRGEVCTWSLGAGCHSMQDSRKGSGRGCRTLHHREVHGQALPKGACSSHKSNNLHPSPHCSRQSWCEDLPHGGGPPTCVGRCRDRRCTSGQSPTT